MRYTLVLIALAGCTPDKMLHIAAGAGIGGVTQSCAASIAAGVAKEAYDATGRGTVDPIDAIATGLSGCAVAYLIDSLAR